MKQQGVLCGMLLLLLCITGVHGFNVGSPRRLLSDPFTSESFTPPHPNPHPPTPTPTPTPKPEPKPVDSNPIGNWFRCAKGFELTIFSVKEIYVTNSTSQIFDLHTKELIGLAAGNCPDIPGTLSPTGSGLPLQQCVFTYRLFSRGSFVETGTFDPSPNGVSNNAVTGIDGAFFQSLGLEHIVNFHDASGAIDTFYICSPRIKPCKRDEKDKDKDDDGHDGHDGHDGNGYNNHP